MQLMEQSVPQIHHKKPKVLEELQRVRGVRPVVGSAITHGTLVQSSCGPVSIPMKPLLKTIEGPKEPLKAPRLRTV